MWHDAGESQELPHEHPCPQDPVAELAANVAAPFGQARAMPKSVYTSEKFLAAEMEHIFGKEWYCVGRASGLANPGDYVTFELANQPLMVVRGHGRHAALPSPMSACTACRRCSKAAATSASSPAPITAGPTTPTARLRGAPAMRRNEGFCKENYRLPQVKCETWLGWVFVSLNPDAEPGGRTLRRCRGSDPPL